MDLTTVRPFIRPMLEKKLGSHLLMIGLILATGHWLHYSLRLITEGHRILGFDSYGASWGILVANIVHVIGISHVGIAISATVRVLGLDEYRKVARIAEFMTLIALVTAVVSIGLDVGRPDRFITATLVHGKWSAPMVWSMTVIVLYFLASLAYLYLSMRRDLWILSGTDLKLNRIYGLLSLGYADTPEVRERHDDTLFWLALCLVPIMISVHSVYGLFFGLLPAKAGWYNPLQAPYFVLGAIVSGFSAILVVGALLRRSYSWQSILPDRFFRVFGSFLAFVVFLYLYFLASEHLTAQFAGPPAEKAVSDSILRGDFAAIFWLAVLVGLVVPFGILLSQGIRKSGVNIPLTALAALFIHIALWLKRFLIVIPAQYNEILPLPRAVEAYAPTYAEIVVTFGSYAFAALLFIAMIRFVPIIELPVEKSVSGSQAGGVSGNRRRIVLLLTLVIGAAMIAWGLVTRDHDYAPVKWLTGIILLIALPLERCLIGDKAARQDACNRMENTLERKLECEK